MDRRQRRTRAAIFSAFSSLLERQSYGSITVQQIIDRADVGRSTFYAHFGTKEDLLRELCGELFGHVMSSAAGGEPGLYSREAAPGSVFCHLLQHLKNGDGCVARLLCSESSGIFLSYFRDQLERLVRGSFPPLSGGELPEGFLINHLCGSFVEMALWWAKRGMPESPEQLSRYFEAVTAPALGWQAGQGQS